MTRKIINEGISRKDLAEILFSRLEHRYPDIVSQNGHERVGDAILDVADRYQGAEELGTSDISIMLKQVMDELEMINEDQNETVSYGLYTADKDEPLMKFNDLNLLKETYSKLVKQYPKKEFIVKKTTQITNNIFLENIDNDVETYKNRLNKIRSTLRGKEYAMAYDKLLKDMPKAHSEYVKRQDRPQMWKGYDRDEFSARSKVDEDLHKWFKEKWVRFGPDGKIRGDCARGDDSEGKPKCLPQSKAHSIGKEGRKYAASKKRREDPNPERRGPAKNVATKKKSNEGIKEMRRSEYAANLAMAGQNDTQQKFVIIDGTNRIIDGPFDSWLEAEHQAKKLKPKYAFLKIKTINMKVSEEQDSCPHCGGEMVSEELMNEKKDACYYKVKSRYKVWPSAYASGALVKCRKKGAKNWGTKSESAIMKGLQSESEED